MLRDEILEIVKKWQDESITEVEVHGFAENLVEQINSNEPPPLLDDIASEVLFQLGIMNHQLITRDDIPAIIDFLHTQEGEETKGWKTWKDYWEWVDFDQRKNELKDTQFYNV